MNKKKLIVVGLLLIIIISASLFFYKYYMMSSEEKYKLKLGFMNEESLRKEIENSFFFETNNEACDLNHYQNFGSKEDCESCVRCTAVQLSNLILEKDLKSLAGKMLMGERAESETLQYFQDNKGLEEEFNQKRESCNCKLID